MGLLDFLFRKKPAKLERDDDTFGRLYLEDGIWTHLDVMDEESAIRFEYMVSVEAGEDGPSDLQRETFAYIEMNLETLVEVAKRFIHQHNSEVPIDTLSVYSVHLHEKAPAEPMRFVIEVCDDSAEEIHRVVFADGIPESYGMDC